MEFNDAKKWLPLANSLTTFCRAFCVGLCSGSSRSLHHSKLVVRVESLSFLGNCRNKCPSHLSPNSWPLSDPTAPTSYPAWTTFLSSIGNHTSYSRKTVRRARGYSVPVLGNYISFSQKSRQAPSI